VRDLCERLATKGFEIAVYTLEQNRKLPQQEWANGVLVKRYRPVFNDPAYVPPPSFLRDLRNLNADILHVHNIHSFLPLFTSLVKKSNQKLILQPNYHRFGQSLVRDTFFSFYKFLSIALVLKRADKVIVNSRYEQMLVKEDFFCNNIVLLPEGLPLNQLRNIRWQLTRPKKILYVGGLRKYKNVDKLLRAFKLLHEKEKELGLVIVGDGPERKRLLKMAQELDINNFIEWKRNLPREQLLLEYAKARVFVSLSLLESFGRTICEAIALGVPTVVLAIGATSDLVKQGLAFGANSTREKDVVAAISKAIASDPKSFKPFRFPFLDMSDYVDQLANIYGSLW